MPQPLYVKHILSEAKVIVNIHCMFCLRFCFRLFKSNSKQQFAWLKVKGVVSLALTMYLIGNHNQFLWCRQNINADKRFFFRSPTLFIIAVQKSLIISLSVSLINNIIIRMTSYSHYSLIQLMFMMWFAIFDSQYKFITFFYFNKTCSRQIRTKYSDPLFVRLIKTPIPTEMVSLINWNCYLE